LTAESVREHRRWLRPLLFAAAVIAATTVLVVAARLVTGSWATGAIVGSISAGVSTAAYPMFFRSGRGSTT